MKKGLLCVYLLLASVAIAGAAPATINYGNFTLSPGTYTNMATWWDVTASDLVLTYRLDLTGITDPTSDWIEVGIRDTNTTANFNPGPWNTYQGGNGGWMTSHVESLVANPVLQNLNDKHNLSASGGRGEGDYDVLSPNGPVLSPTIGSFNNYGIWFDRDGVAASQATLWGAVNGDTYNTAGIYDIQVTFHALSDSLGTMFAKVNGIQTGFYSGGWKNAQPENYPAGLSFKADMDNMRVFLGYWAPGADDGDAVVSDLTANGATPELPPTALLGLASLPLGWGWLRRRRR